MTIEIVDGQSERLYSLVAPLVMDRNVLHHNHNYPFWTSPSHIWFIAWDGKKNVRAFFPIEINKKGEAKINNYFMAGVESQVFKPIIKEIITYCRRKYNLQAVALMPHKELFKAAGFRATKEWKLFVKMEYGRKKQQEEGKEDKPETTGKTGKAGKTTRTAKTTKAASSKKKTNRTTAQASKTAKRK